MTDGGSAELLPGLRLGVLWIFMSGGWVVGYSLNLMLPGVIQGMLVRGR